MHAYSIYGRSTINYEQQLKTTKHKTNGPIQLQLVLHVHEDTWKKSAKLSLWCTYSKHFDLT